MNATPQLRGEIAEIVGIVAHARAQAAAGDRFNLTHLPERVAGLCQAIEAIPSENAGPYLEVMEKLIDDLNAIAGHVKDQSVDLQRRLLELQSTAPADPETALS